MTRVINAPNETASLEARQSIGILVSLDFASGFVRVTNRDHPVIFGGNSYTGLGAMGSINKVTEGTDLRPNDVRLTLNGLDPALVATALTEDYHGRAALIYVGWFDDDQLFRADPEQVFRGYMDYMTVAVGQGSAQITVVCENEFARWGRSKSLLFTDSSQRLLYATDSGFDQVPYLKNKIIRWGGERVYVPTVTDVPDFTQLGL